LTDLKDLVDEVKTFSDGIELWTVIRMEDRHNDHGMLFIRPENFDQKDGMVPGIQREVFLSEISDDLDVRVILPLLCSVIYVLQHNEHLILNARRIDKKFLY